MPRQAGSCLSSQTLGRIRVLLWVAVAVAVLLALIHLDSRRKTRRLEAAFRGRTRLTPAEFFEVHFKEVGAPAQVVEGVRQVLEEQFGADLSRLSRDDDLSRNLNFLFDYDSLVDVEIVNALEERFGITISDEEAQNAKTVIAIVELVTTNLKVKNAA